MAIQIYSALRVKQQFVTGATGNLGSSILKRLEEFNSKDHSKYVAGLRRKNESMLSGRESKIFRVERAKSVIHKCYLPFAEESSEAEVSERPPIIETRLIVAPESFDSNTITKIITDETKEGQKVLFINTIGGAHPSGGQTEEGFKALNEKTAIVCADALKIAKKQRSLDTLFLQFSSIMAIDSLCQSNLYGKTKRDTDLQLLENYKEINPLCFRIGYVISTMAGDSTDHLYSGEDLATLPMQPIVFNGMQPIQPVTINAILFSLFSTYPIFLSKIRA